MKRTIISNEQRSYFVMLMDGGGCGKTLVISRHDERVQRGVSSSYEAYQPFFCFRVFGQPRSAHGCACLVPLFYSTWYIYTRYASSTRRKYEIRVALGGAEGVE